MEDFHVHFEKASQTYDVTFREQQSVSHDTVLVIKQQFFCKLQNV